MVDNCPGTVYGPCTPLVMIDDLACDCGLDLNVESNSTLLDKAFGWASRRVMLATNYRFMGCCSAVIRPCRVPCDPWQYMRRMDGMSTPNGHLFDEYGWSGFPTIPLQMTSGPTPTFINCWACTCSPAGIGDAIGCGCGMGGAIALPYLPVRDVTEVKVDGVVVDPTTYRVMPGTNLLVKLDGTHWPDTQNELLDDTEVGTMSIAFRHGLDLPPEGKPIVAMYACQLAKRCAGMKCDLPEGLRVVSRPGVGYEFAVLDTAYREQGLTGYPPLDDWLFQIFGGHSKTRPHLVYNRTRRLSMLG